MSKKILVVDDTSSIREALENLLRPEGYDVSLAANGREAIAKFNAEVMDLLVLDVNLPDISGREVFETLTQINPFLPVIVITGDAAQRHLPVWAATGGVLVKPLSVPLLLTMVAELLGESPATRTHRLAGRDGAIRFGGSQDGNCVVKAYER